MKFSVKAASNDSSPAIESNVKPLPDGVGSTATGSAGHPLSCQGGTGPYAAGKQYFTWLIFACFLLFPFKRSVELPLLLLSIGGFVLAYRHGASFFQQPAVRLFTFLFVSIWVPMLLSVPDSYHLKSSLSTALSFPRLYLAGLFLICTLSQQEESRLLVKLLAYLAAIWVVDALFQAMTGHNFLGYAQIPARLNGVFGENSLKLGNALPVLAPFLILVLRSKPLLMLLAALMVGAVVILAGSRGGWVSFGLVCVWLVISEAQRRGISLWKIGAVAALVGVVGILAVFENPGARQRLDQTLLLFSGEEAKVDLALSYRWTIWQDAFAMVEQHPINGVGVRAFRHAYPEFAQPADPFVQADIDADSVGQTGAFYAHQIVLEVMSETGLIGLAGLVWFYALLVRAWYRADRERRILSLPFAMAALAWLFPFNTHPAFYSAQWSVLIWLVLAMLCASLYPVRQHVMLQGR